LPSDVVVGVGGCGVGAGGVGERTGEGCITGGDTGDERVLLLLFEFVLLPPPQAQHA